MATFRTPTRLMVASAAMAAACEREVDVDAGVMAAFDWRRARAHVDVLADDALGGRIPGSPGSAAARDYLIGELVEAGVEPFGIDGSFEFPFEEAPYGVGGFMLDADGAVVPHEYTSGVDLVGVVPGVDPERADEHVVWVAHYDHLGVDADGAVYNGAFDDAAAVATLVELARALRESDTRLDRSVVVLLTDHEEAGLTGAERWIQSSPVPLDDVVLAVAADPLGRPLLEDYGPIVVLGAEHVEGLAERVAAAADPAGAPVVQVDRSAIRLFASDHDPFLLADPPVPALWLSNPGMSFYHQTDDDADTIDYRMIEQSAAFLARLTVDVANSDVTFPWRGAPPLGVDSARGALTIVDGVLASDELDDDERVVAERLRGDLLVVIEAGTFDVVEDPDTFVLGAMAFLLGRLPTAHPGPIPPPTPGPTE
jgi:Zn-dependent M28 family amino/carboxypeptidase